MKCLFYTLAFAVLTASTCRKTDERCGEGSHNGITFQNKSARKICFEIYWRYPDTTIGAYNPLQAGLVEPGKTQVRGAGPGSCWEAVLMDLPQQKEWVYIFDQDSLRTIPWNIVQKTNRGLLARKIISIDSLRRYDFTITYQ